jgi:hypothetical protein
LPQTPTTTPPRKFIFFDNKIEKKPSMMKPNPTPVQSVSPRIQTPTPVVVTTPTTQSSSNNSSKTSIMSQITDSIGFSFFTGSSSSSSSGKKKLKIGNPSNVVHTGTSTKQDPSKKKTKKNNKNSKNIQR